MAEYVVEFGKDGGPVEPDGRLDAPAFHRNHQAIWAVLQPFLAGKSGDVVEAGSGTGQHVVDFARRSPEITWWPSDLNDQHLKSIAAWRAHAGLENIRPPLRIDLSEPVWCSQTGAGHYLRADGRLFLYGPFKRDGKHTALSNAAFDASLRDRDPEWGVRDIADLEKLAAVAGLVLIDIAEMPANNLILVFARPKAA